MKRKLIVGAAITAASALAVLVGGTSSDALDAGKYVIGHFGKY